MKKILAVLLIIVMTLMAAACGGEAGDGGDAAMDSKNSRSYNGFGSSYVSEPAAEMSEMPADEYDGDMSIEEGGNEGQSGVTVGKTGSLIGQKVKLIYTGELYVQTLDYDEAVDGLNKLVEKFGGYFESISSDNGNYYNDDSYKYGSFTVRVPSEKFQSFVNSVSEGMHVVNMNQNAQDIGQMYFETERRLETLKNKHDRLEELLKQAKKMSDIIDLESALSDTEYEIEQYSTELNRYDSLVSYSTVYVNIEKVNEFSQGIEEELTFGQRLLRSISQGASNFGWWLEDLVNWIGYNLIQLLILAALIIVVVRLHLVRRIGNLFGGKKKQDYVIVRKDEGENK